MMKTATTTTMTKTATRDDNNNGNEVEEDVHDLSPAKRANSSKEQRRRAQIGLKLIHKAFGFDGLDTMLMKHDDDDDVVHFVWRCHQSAW